jgi:hypothetical protein
MTDTTLTPDASQCARLMMGTGLGALPTPRRARPRHHAAFAVVPFAAHAMGSCS